MSLISPILGICWLIFMVTWVAFAIKAKKSVRSNGRTRFIRMLVVAAIATVFSVHDVRVYLATHTFIHNIYIQYPGVAMCIMGIAFAIWARVHLGTNWGRPMSMRQEHDLITSGPYRYVRHPIYSGIGLAMFGSALAGGYIYLIFFFISSIYFIISAKTEEQLMLKQFPNQYPGYMQRSKMFVPFIF
jgi:protein-S-isoprenylcysteine O-methyltransferase Ste14